MSKTDGHEQVTNYDLPGVNISKSINNPQFDPYTTAWHFDQWQDMEVLLLGNWINKIDQYKKL